MGGRAREGTLHSPRPCGCDRVSRSFRKEQLRFRSKQEKEKKQSGGGSLFLHLLTKGRKGFSPQRSSSCTPRGQSVAGGAAGDTHQGRMALEGPADSDCRKGEMAPTHRCPVTREGSPRVAGSPGHGGGRTPGQVAVEGRASGVSVRRRGLSSAEEVPREGAPSQDEE